MLDTTLIVLPLMCSSAVTPIDAIPVLVQVPRAVLLVSVWRPNLLWHGS